MCILLKTDEIFGFSEKSVTLRGSSKDSAIYVLCCLETCQYSLIFKANPRKLSRHDQQVLFSERQQEGF